MIWKNFSPKEKSDHKIQKLLVGIYLSCDCVNISMYLPQFFFLRSHLKCHPSSICGDLFLIIVFVESPRIVWFLFCYDQQFSKNLNVISISRLITIIY